MLSLADAKAFLSSSEARQMSESDLERELHRRGQDLVRKLLCGFRGKPITDSGRNRSLIPAETDH